jgi:hypothetical protein
MKICYIENFPFKIQRFIYFLRNIATILCVNTNPPTILTAASITESKPKIDEREQHNDDFATTIPPTIMTLEMALVTAINGECRAGVTFITT